MALPSTTQHPVELNGKIYYASPLTDEAYDRLDEYVRALYARGQSALLDATNNKVAQQLIIEASLQQMALLQWSDGLGRKMITTVAGMMQLLYESVRLNHPELSFNQFRKDLRETIKTDDKLVQYSTMIFNHLNANTNTTGKEPPKGKAVRPTRRRLPKRKSTKS